MKQIAVEFDGPEGLVTKAKLDVIDYLPYEPSNYVTDPGWICELVTTAGTRLDYFVNESGVVFNIPENEEVGIAPELKTASDKIQNELEELWNRSPDRWDQERESHPTLSEKVDALDPDRFYDEDPPEPEVV